MCFKSKEKYTEIDVELPACKLTVYSTATLSFSKACEKQKKAVNIKKLIPQNRHCKIISFQ